MLEKETKHMQDKTKQDTQWFCSCLLFFEKTQVHLASRWVKYEQ